MSIRCVCVLGVRLDEIIPVAKDNSMSLFFEGLTGKLMEKQSGIRYSENILSINYSAKLSILTVRILQGKAVINYG